MKKLTRNLTVTEPCESFCEVIHGVYHRILQFKSDTEPVVGICHWYLLGPSQVVTTNLDIDIFVF